MNIKKIAAMMVGVSSVALSSQALAQEAPGVQEVIVTATRRAENIQNVPIAVTAISGKAFEESQFKNPIDLQYVSPSIQMSASGGIGFTVRGVGTNSFNPATEQAVGLSVDGVVYGFVDDIGADLSDVNRIEVLRGPQGTQFGKNATAGVISITTIKPQIGQFMADAHGSYGSYRDSNDWVRLNIPVNDTLAASLQGAFQNRDGFIYNPVLRETQGQQQQWGLKGKLLWTPNENFSAYAIVDFHDARWTPNFLSTYRALGVGGFGFPPGIGIRNYGIVPGPDNQVTGDGGNSVRNTETGGASLELNYRFGGGYTFTSLSAIRSLSRHEFLTAGGTPVQIIAGPDDVQAQQLSQEFRVTSPDTGNLRYVAGIYLYDRTNKEKELLAGTLGSSAPNAPVFSFDGGVDVSKYDVVSYAAFVDGSYQLTSQLSLIGGLRVARNTADANQSTLPVPGVGSLSGSVNGSSSGSVASTDYAYRAGVQYAFTPTVMGYVTASRGFKGPIALPVPSKSVRDILPETGNSIELGVKSSLFDGSATINVAVFHEQFTDFQATVLDNSLPPPGFVLGNAGGMLSQGVEFESSVRPIAGLSLGANVTYQDAHFTDFRTSCQEAFEPIPQSPTKNPSGVGGCYTSPVTGNSFIQAAGSPLPNASRWNYTLSGAYTHRVTPQLDGEISANYLYRSDFYTNGADPNTKIGGYGVLGATVSVGPSNGAWKVGIFARNLLDQYFVSGVETGVFDTGALTNVINPEAHRTIGVILDAHF
jgi:iron complex outermembrane receptor protein